MNESGTVEMNGILKQRKLTIGMDLGDKLAVLLHKPWISGEAYEPLRNNHKAAAAVAQEGGF